LFVAQHQTETVGQQSGPSGEESLILVAEDNEDNRLIAATMLRHVGYRVAEATTGAEALDMARSLRPALVLMDVGMPDIDGWTATRALKSDPETRDIIIIAFTAHALPGDRETALSAGCDGYLAKPIEPRRLAQEVARALSTGETS
jgi:two-component system, cell cycle response regulator DivK